MGAIPSSPDSWLLPPWVGGRLERRFGVCTTRSASRFASTLDFLMRLLLQRDEAQARMVNDNLVRTLTLFAQRGVHDALVEDVRMRDQMVAMMANLNDAARATNDAHQFPPRGFFMPFADGGDDDDNNN